MPEDKNVNYYEEHAGQYAKVNDPVSMAAFYDLFLPNIPSGGRILDAGCGTGRDSAEFLKRGYQVEAFDASPQMVRLAREKTGLTVSLDRFQTFVGKGLYDGIWASASLLHVPFPELPEVFTRLAGQLTPKGVMYASFKKGKGFLDAFGRQFTLLDEAGLDQILRLAPVFTVITQHTNADSRDPALPQWFNLILGKNKKPAC